MSNTKSFIDSLEDVTDIMEIEDDFLPKGYEEPKSNKYMKFKLGDNKFRILSNSIVGYEWWIEEKDEKNQVIKKPVRIRMDEFEDRVHEAPDRKSVKLFWAMVVYNYATEDISILEITQKGIRDSINSLREDKDWGSPRGYDLVVARSGEGYDTNYNLIPKPKSEVTEEIKKRYESMHINLEALFDGGDPYAE